MITIRDDAGAGLAGAIDGVNQTYRTSQPMRLDRVVDVYVNGICRMAELDNGYELRGVQEVWLKEAPLPGDTLTVRYSCTGVEVGVPNAQLPSPQVLGATLDPPIVRNPGCPCG